LKKHPELVAELVAELDAELVAGGGRLRLGSRPQIWRKKRWRGAW
jgi:hypothetical protein